MPRVTALRDPITIELDGAPVLADRGEPVAVALIAAGHIGLARSPKFHRPRGPSCLRGACDGCLARVDGVPNVMTCRVPAAPAMRVETQNVLGSRRRDVLRAADWLFPRGMNHHEILVNVPGLRSLMQGLARRIAGLGKLPSEPAGCTAAVRRTVDVLVVGAGPSGMAAAVEFHRRGRQVEVIDADFAWGGCTQWLPAPAAGAWEPLRAAFALAVAGGVSARMRTTAAGIYGDDVLLAREGGVEVVTARMLMLAPGAHDGVLAFEGNDLPGIYSARAACRLLAHGVVPGERTVVVTPLRGTSQFATAYARGWPRARLVQGRLTRALGVSRVRQVALEVAATPDKRDVAPDRDAPRRLISDRLTVSDRLTLVKEALAIPCDALVVDAQPAPAYELCAQAGAELRHEEAGFVVCTGAGGAIRAGVAALGEVVGTALEPETVAAEARAAADLAR